MRAQCSACDAEIDADSPQCPVCMQERTRAEIFQALRGVDARRSSRRAAALKGVFLMILGIGGTALGFRWTMEKRAAAAVAARAQAEKVKKDAEVLRREVTARQSEMPVSAPGGDPSEDGDDTAQRQPPRPASAVKDWSVRGEVYDLQSLAAVRSAKVSFSSESGVRRVTTGPDGRFRILLPKAGAPYTVAISHPKYAGTFVEDGSPPYRLQGKGLRLNALESFRASQILNVPLSPPEEDDSLELAYVLIPE